jgi:hypothetical protein
MRRGNMGVLVVRTVVAVLGLLFLSAVSGWAASASVVLADDRMDQCLDITYDNKDTHDRGKGISDERADFSNLCSEPIAFTICYVDYKGAAQGGTLTCEFVPEVKPKAKKALSRYFVFGYTSYYEACRLQDQVCIGYAKDFYDECNGKFCQY